MGWIKIQESHKKWAIFFFFEAMEMMDAEEFSNNMFISTLTQRCSLTTWTPPRIPSWLWHLQYRLSRQYVHPDWRFFWIGIKKFGGHWIFQPQTRLYAHCYLVGAPTSAPMVMYSAALHQASDGFRVVRTSGFPFWKVPLAS